MSDVIKSLGGPTAIARLLGIRAPSVSEWKGRIPVERRVELERALYPLTQVEDMGGDVRWVRVADVEWPHPGGRPCVDLALPTKAAA